MVKRIIWLALLACALLLLMGQMATNGEAALPRALVHSALAAQPATPAPAPTPQAETAIAKISHISDANTFPVQQPPIKLRTVYAPHYQMCYFAFHYPDEAG